MHQQRLFLASTFLTPTEEGKWLGTPQLCKSPSKSMEVKLVHHLPSLTASALASVIAFREQHHSITLSSSWTAAFRSKNVFRQFPFRESMLLSRVCVRPLWPGPSLRSNALICARGLYTPHYSPVKHQLATFTSFSGTSLHHHRAGRLR